MLPENLHWRVGRKVGRTIYAVGFNGLDHDLLVGVMDTPALATEAVRAHNLRLVRESTLRDARSAVRDAQRFGRGETGFHGGDYPTRAAVLAICQAVLEILDVLDPEGR